MTSCWTTLEIQPTNDVDVISKARRLLIKRWHPDTVPNPVQKNVYTVRCARRNVAHDEPLLDIQ